MFCPALLAPSVSPEERIEQFYIKLLGEYRTSLGDDVKFSETLATALHGGKPFDLPTFRTEPTRLREYLRQLASFEKTGSLTNGEKIDLTTLRSRLRSHLGKVLKNVQEGQKAIRRTVRKTQSIQTAYRDLRGHTRRITDVNISPDLTRAVSAAGDNTVIIWNLKTGKAMYSLKDPLHSVVQIRISPDSKQVLTLDEVENLTVWNLSTGKVRFKIEMGEGLRFLETTPDFKFALGGGMNQGRIFSGT